MDRARHTSFVIQPYVHVHYNAVYTCINMRVGEYTALGMSANAHEMH